MPGRSRIRFISPMLHLSGHLLLSLVNPSNTLDQHTVTIDHQNSSLGFVNSVPKRDEQTMDSLQPRDQVVDKRAEPDEKTAADSSMVRCRSDHPDEFMVPLDDANEEITEQCQDGFHDWYTCPDGQCSVKSTRISSGVLPVTKQQQHLFVSQTPDLFYFFF